MIDKLKYNGYDYDTSNWHDQDYIIEDYDPHGKPNCGYVVTGKFEDYEGQEKVAKELYKAKQMMHRRAQKVMGIENVRVYQAFKRSDDKYDLIQIEDWRKLI